MLSTQAMLVIFISFLLIINFEVYGSKFYFLRKMLFLKRKKYFYFSFLIKTVLFIFCIYISYQYFNNSFIFDNFSGSNKGNQNYLSFSITLIGTTLGLIQFSNYRKSAKESSDITYFYKLLDILKKTIETIESSEGSDFFQKNLSSYITNIKDINQQKKYNLFVNLVLFREVTSHYRLTHFFIYLYFYCAIDFYAHIYKLSTKCKKDLVKCLNIINHKGIIQNNYIIGIPSSKQYDYMNIVCSYIINNNPDYAIYKRYVPEYNQLSEDVFLVLKKTGFLKYIVGYFPNQKHELYSPQYEFVQTFFALNLIINNKKNYKIDEVCRYIHRLIKVVNSMHISIDKKFSYYGLVRSILSPDALTLVYLNASFSYKGVGLSRQLIGTCFFGNDTELQGQNVRGHINIIDLPSNSQRIMCKRILINYYGSYIYPGKISKKKVIYTMMRKLNKSQTRKQFGINKILKKMKL